MVSKKEIEKARERYNQKVKPIVNIQYIDTLGKTLEKINQKRRNKAIKSYSKYY